MKLFSLPPLVRGFVFDVDSTLYTDEAFASAQLRVQFERFREIRNIGADEAESIVEGYRREWSEANGGAKISLGNTFAAFGITIEESIRWREELVRPEDFLRPDPRLRAALERLSARVPLAIVTNNPASIGRRTVAALGVADLFLDVVGLDSCGVSKPHEAPCRAAASVLGVPEDACVSVGDRYDIDIALPLKMGMGGILVDGVEDVYALPAALADRLPAPSR